MKRMILAAAACQFILNVNAQGEKFTMHVQPRNGVYVDETVGIKRKMQYDYLRQANVSWEKRVWRSIDLREKINQHLMFPATETQNRISMFDLIKKGITSGQLTVYEDDNFTKAYSQDEAFGQFFKNVMISVEDSNGNKIRDTIVKEELTSEKFTRFNLKEDWYFNKERGVQEVRILGISPVYYDEGKDMYIEKGWIYFPEARDLFVSHKTYNPKNDASTTTFDDLFQKRYFSSAIQKESNVFDRYFSQYAVGIEALGEAERVKKEIYGWEHDLWSF